MYVCVMTGSGENDYSRKSRGLSKFLLPPPDESDILVRTFREEMLKDPAARVTHRQSWGAYHLMVLETPEIASRAAPGQFIMVRTSPLYPPLLRRPFSIHARSGSEIALFFQAVGTGTELLSRMTPGRTLDILGPLGRGFDLAGGPAVRQAVLVGGLVLVVDGLINRGMRLVSQR